MQRSTKTLRQFLTNPIALACAAIILAAILYGLWAVAINHPKQGKTSAQDCTPDPTTLVNPCRPLIGSFSGGYAQAASDGISQLKFLNKRLNDPNVLTNASLSPTITQKIDIAHIYKGQGNNLLSASDKTLLADSTFPYVMINWKPLPAGYTWKDACGVTDPTTGCVDNPTVDAYIKAGADALKTVNKKVFLTVFHEPENDVSSGNCTTNATGAGMGSPAQYVAMWNYVHQVFKREYGTTPSNVIWVMNYMGFPKWNCLIPLLWPGNTNVDWIVWDPYGSADSGYNSSIDNLYNYFTVTTPASANHNDAAHAYLTKPLGFNEFGYGSGGSTTFNDAGAMQYWKDALTSIQQNKYPLVKMYNVFDTNANNAHSQVGANIDGTPSVAKQIEYNAFANAIFAKAASVPTADTTPPTVTISTPGSGTTLVGTASVVATASDNIAVTDVKFYVDTTLIQDDTTIGDGWSLQWDTTTVANGAHTLKAVAYDAAGNTKTSSSDVVVNNPVVPKISSFTATPSSVASGGTSALAWATTDTTSCSVTPGGSTNTTSTSWQTGALTASTTFTLTCVNGATTVTKTVAVTVVPVPKISSFSASPASVTVNGTSMLSWATTNTSSCSVGPNGPTDMTTTSWQTLGLTTVGTTTYTLTCKNSVGASTTATANVAVTAPPTAPTSLVLTASASTVPAGGSVTLSWTSVGSDYCVLYPGAYKAMGTTSSKTLTNFQKTTTYYLNCYNSVGKTVSKGLTVSLGAATATAPVITHFAATPNPVAAKGQSTLSWSTTNVPQGGCSLAPSSLTSTWPNGQYTTPSLTKSTTYTLTCKNSAGKSVSQTVTVKVSGTAAFATGRYIDIALASAHLNRTVASAATDSSASADGSTIKATTGETVIDASKVASVPQNSLVTLDPATVTDSTQIAQIARLEYYNGSKLVQTVKSTPFALNTQLLGAGSYNITERVYFKDGSSAQVAQLITVQKSQAVSSTSGSSKQGLAAAVVVAVVVLACGVSVWLVLARKRAGTATMPADSAVVLPPADQTPTVMAPSQKQPDSGDGSNDNPQPPQQF